MDEEDDGLEFSFASDIEDTVALSDFEGDGEEETLPLEKRQRTHEPVAAQAALPEEDRLQPGPLFTFAEWFSVDPERSIKWNPPKVSARKCAAKAQEGQPGAGSSKPVPLPPLKRRLRPAEHTRYLTLRKKRELSQEETREFNALNDIVQTEQKHYIASRKEHANQCLLCEADKKAGKQEPSHTLHANLSFFFPEVREIMLGLLDVAFASCGQSGFSKPVATTPLPGTITSGVAIPLTFQAVLTEAYQVPPLVALNTPFLPPYESPFDLPAHRCDRFPFRKAVDTPAVSADTHCRSLCAQREIDVAISAAAFVALATTSVAEFKQEYALPVVIEQVDGRNCIFVDKPIPKKKYTPRALNERFYKWAFWAKSCRGESGDAPPAAASDNPVPAMQYVAWKLGESRVLVRERVHGTLGPGTRSSGGGKPEPAIIRAKMEYLNKGYELDRDSSRHYDFEEFTPEEWARFYFMLELRPASRLHLAHVNTFTSTVLRMNYFTLSSLRTYLDQLHTDRPFQRELCLLHVHLVIQQLRKLTPGKYLVRHEPGSRSVQVLPAAGPTEMATGQCHINLENPAGSSPLQGTPVDPRIDTMANTFIPPSVLITNLCTRIPATYPPHVNTKDPAITFNHSTFFAKGPDGVVIEMKAPESVESLGQRRNWTLNTGVQKTKNRPKPRANLTLAGSTDP
eukprot:TRINITY_DN8236_c0_g1_i1.p1 TRINITY_DN8236_c0_g1~~TRINITY_DN8236_c0_g1_i1.p1  ORF type:complete len:683 (-),score=110.07 TRINITY_DN8236_c0_g1_i1:7-2055(-)